MRFVYFMDQRQLVVQTKHLFVCLLCIPLFILAGCAPGGGSTDITSPTPTPDLQYQTLNLGIPQKVISAPITGSVPDSQILQVTTRACNYSFHTHHKRTKYEGGAVIAVCFI
jgi:hypothetical protein